MKIYSEIRKDTEMRKLFISPFDRIEEKSKVIIYGASFLGSRYLWQMQNFKYGDVLFLVDKRHNEIGSILGVEVKSPDAILQADYDFILVAGLTESVRESIKSDLHNLKIDPNKIVYDIGESSQLFGGMTFSQHGEDLVVMNIFNYLGIKKPSYIDIGANHPYNSSNTALMYRLGSRGINIEPNPDLIETFYSERPDDVNLPVGVSDKEGTLDFYMFDNTVAFMNTFSLDAANDFTKRFPEYEIKRVKKIPVTTIPEIIGRHRNGEYPDYMSIDVEGLDFEVLSVCDFTKVMPLVITVEINKEDASVKINHLLNAKNYVPYCRTGVNITYVHKEVQGKLFV